MDDFIHEQCQLGVEAQSSWMVEAVARVGAAAIEDIGRNIVSGASPSFSVFVVVPLSSGDGAFSIYHFCAYNIAI